MVARLYRSGIQAEDEPEEPDRYGLATFPDRYAPLPAATAALEPARTARKGAQTTTAQRINSQIHRNPFIDILS